MPKIVSEHEKEMVRKAMYIKGIELIRQKGVKRVTVDDIAAAAQIGKGTFYAYYSSKEHFLYAIIKQAEQWLFARVEEVLAGQLGKKQRILKALKEIYLAADSIVLAVTPEDIEYLLRKLPSEVEDWEARKSNDYFARTAALCDIDPAHCNPAVLAHLMEALHYMLSSGQQTETAERAQAIDIMVETIAAYMAGERS
ncbi:TetR/AcrR family transcriptional regulator [Paenibacillus sp. GCM10027626]|uniref:TetR/AcrR family transcriptional regulator n=1 Tax=Paenibacillus sp. GCM10027626 TaxID=3273411 RepID=UPI0036252A64